MCVFLISQVPIAEPLTSELIDTPVFHNLAPRPIKYRVSVPIPTLDDTFCTVTICQMVWWQKKKNGSEWHEKNPVSQHFKSE